MFAVALAGLYSKSDIDAQKAIQDRTGKDSSKDSSEDMIKMIIIYSWIDDSTSDIDAQKGDPRWHW